VTAVVVIVFRITLRPDLDVGDYAAVGARMVELASGMPGFVGMDYAEVEGGELLVVRFESHESLAAWRAHPEHLEAQRAGRERFFKHYRIEVCDEVRSYEFDADGEA
jgi:heme-degrading monooxygenase HmoA